MIGCVCQYVHMCLTTLPWQIGGYVQNAPQELWFLASDNLLTETNASKIRWTLLPEGDHGILPPGVTEGPPTDPKGDILEEAHIVPLAMGGYYVVGRTTQVGCVLRPLPDHYTHGYR